VRASRAKQFWRPITIYTVFSGAATNSQNEKNNFLAFKEKKNGIHSVQLSKKILPHTTGASRFK